jgi:hypothetical protein
LSKDDKLSVLIMRDDSQVRRYRLRVGWFKLFFYVQIVLLIAAVGGSYAGIKFWGQHLELANENKAKQEELAAMSIQLERLQNIEEILKTNDPAEIKSLFNAVTKEREPLQPSIDLNDLFVSKDLQVAAVANLQLKQNADDLRISFELNNMSDEVLSGRTRIYAITNDARVVEVQGEEAELSFEIQRFRRVNSRLQFPEKITLDSVFAIRLVITDNENQELFLQTYPLSNILTS